MGYKLNWQDRRELTESLKDIENHFSLEFDTDFNPVEYKARIKKAVEAISELASQVDSQEQLLNNYKSVLRDVLSR